MRFTQRILLCFFLAGFVLCAADLTGNWSGTLETERGVDDHFLTLKQVGSEITGTVGPSGVSWPIKDVKLEGSKLTFHVSVPGPDWLLTYELNVSDASLSGIMTTEKGPQISGKLQFKRNR